MHIQLNGEPLKTSALTLDHLLSKAGFNGATVATAVNGSFVPLALRPDHALVDGDQVEVLAPMQGG